jgi:hypothetical protein
MTKALALGTVKGGLTAFAWNMVSHELLSRREKCRDAVFGTSTISRAT